MKEKSLSEKAEFEIDRLQKKIVEIRKEQAEAVKRLKKEEDKEFCELMEAICEFALYEGIGVWDSSKIFGNERPNIKFIGEKIKKIIRLKDEIFGPKLTGVKE